ncbi:MAG: family 20 glycosylhydrolase [Clostridia bacterium]|nr:family 20 glycosylhydrolase [Clostridia bacterium]
MNFIPAPKKVTETGGVFAFSAVKSCDFSDERLKKAYNKLPVSNEGAEVVFDIKDGDKESYKITVSDKIEVLADGVNGAFYAIQTLRQMFENKEIPCMEIVDEPDFSYRGFYHDMTRGRVPTVETVKGLIDKLAYFKQNSLQLYVEHTYPFKEFFGSVSDDNCLAPDEIKELDAYARENFIDLIPSIATFGHLYELLEQNEYKNLQAAKATRDTFLWDRRMWHHTIDPKNPESIEIIKSMIDQYMENFTSQYFNICCDETFDLKTGKYEGEDTGALYVEFVKKIIAHVESKGKTVMMWSDILLNYPEVINDMPESVVYLNWDYAAEPSEDKIKQFSETGRNQYLCPGTDSWEGIIERISNAEPNITNMAEYGKKYGAKGILNTNWGDWGNLANLDMAMFGLSVGADKSWNLSGGEIDRRMDVLVYKKEGASKLIREVSDVCSKIQWNQMNVYLKNRKDFEKETPPTEEYLRETRRRLPEIVSELEGQTWGADNFRKSLIMASECFIIMAEFFSKIQGCEKPYSIDIDKWLEKYKADWRKECKESEIKNIVEVFEMTKEY